VHTQAAGKVEQKERQFLTASFRRRVRISDSEWRLCLYSGDFLERWKKE